jgi:osmotically-inducible protein OsmY
MTACPPRHPGHRSGRRALLAGLTVGALAAALGGCAPLVMGGAAVGGVLFASDRRTSGTVVDDQGIELKAGPRIREVIGERGHINVTSFNRVLLLTGEVPTEADKAAVAASLSKLENLKGLLNELAVGPNSALFDRSNDALITSKVKASYVDAKDLFANAFKVVTERGVVHLMGRVTEREATRAVEIARGVGGVKKVVRAFEILTEAELAQVQPPTSPPATK